MNSARDFMVVVKKGFISLLILSTLACNEQVCPEVDVTLITEKDVYDLMDSWLEAMRTNNSKQLKQILDDSWSYTGGSDGTTSNKEQALEGFESADGETTMLALNLTDTQIKLYGDIAIVTALEEFVTVNHKTKDTITSFIRFTDVYQKRGNKVIALTTHTSPILVDKNKK